MIPTYQFCYWLYQITTITITITGCLLVLTWQGLAIRRCFQGLIWSLTGRRHALHPAVLAVESAQSHHSACSRCCQHYKSQQATSVCKHFITCLKKIGLKKQL